MLHCFFPVFLFASAVMTVTYCWVLAKVSLNLNAEPDLQDGPETAAAGSNTTDSEPPEPKIPYEPDHIPESIYLHILYVMTSYINYFVCANMVFWPVFVCCAACCTIYYERRIR